ncbi:MAG: hypothetical protein KJ002_02585 [Candidatus Dadabacteria bacterium]|nr:hypothetical protein [Candidatus Dadabacteria bacterium]
MAKTLTVKETSKITGEVIEKEIDLSSLTVPELRAKFKAAYGVDLSRANAKRLLNGEEIRIKNVIFPERPAPKV